MTAPIDDEFEDGRANEKANVFQKMLSADVNEWNIYSDQALVMEMSQGFLRDGFKFLVHL